MGSVILNILNTPVLALCVASMVWSVWVHVSLYDFQFANWSRFYIWV